MTFIIILSVSLFIFFVIVTFLISRYKRCPSDKILVVYGKTGKGASKCIHGGAAFVWPVIQAYEFLDLTPISIEVNLTGALSRQNIRMDVPSRFTVGISNEVGIMENAANRLLGIKQEDVKSLAHDIIVGQMRLVIATMNIEEINADRDKFVHNVYNNVGSELKKIGLNLINVNVTDIHDESGYIEALGKEAAAHAVNEARKLVAEKNRDGAIGEARAQQDQRVQVARAEAQAKVGEAEANAQAVEGENLSRVAIAQSEALRREKEAEANKNATAAEKIQAAKALEEAYLAEKEAEEARAARERASREADEIVQAEIEKQKEIIQAEAEAQQARILAEGEAAAVLARQKAQAEGIFEVLSKQAEGFDKIVAAANDNTRDAVLLLIADKLPELVKMQVEAIKNIKIDKVTVWEGANGSADTTSTSRFISGLYKAVPPLSEVFAMAGLDLPDYLVKQQNNALEAIPDKGNNGHDTSDYPTAADYTQDQEPL